MEFEDSRFALFPEPNAYIQKFDSKKKETKKIVFQEPYESMPAFYLDNNFKKGDCSCSHNWVNNKFNQGGGKHHCQPNQCNNKNNHNSNQHNDNCHKETPIGFRFDLKSFLPLISMFNKGGGADLSNIVGLLNNTKSSQTQSLQNGNNTNPMALISSLLSNKDAMSGILNLFKGGGLNIFNKKQSTKREIKTTDFEIKNYTRVK